MKKTLLILITLLLTFSATPISTLAAPTKFTLPPLPYAYDALEPYIDKETMIIHHDKHHQAYVDNLNKALDKYPYLYSRSLEDLLSNVNSLPSDIKTQVINNGGGNYNHTLFWNIMTDSSSKKPSGTLLNAINRDFGSFESFKTKFNEVALSRFGSGWAYLVSDSAGKLSIISTANQDTPIPLNLKPIILLDVWEHAYYLKYQNRRIEYINNWWNVVNWDMAQTNYTK
ncbi:MAG: superoxide dismutase [Clostridium sp.]